MAALRGVAVILGAGPGACARGRLSDRFRASFGVDVLELCAFPVLGLGASLAKKFAAKGLLVAAGSRSGAAAASTTEGVKAYTVDASDAASVEAFVAAAEADLGPVVSRIELLSLSHTLKTLPDSCSLQRGWRKHIPHGLNLDAPGGRH